MRNIMANIGPHLLSPSSLFSATFSGHIREPILSAPAEGGGRRGQGGGESIWSLPPLLPAPRLIAQIKDIRS